jgi:hypothetical protein
MCHLHLRRLHGCGVGGIDGRNLKSMIKEYPPVILKPSFMVITHMAKSY